MNGYSTSNDHQPITYWRNVPLFAAHVIVVVFVISMIATALLSFWNQSAFLSLAVFDSVRVLKGEIWRVVTYGLVNPPSLWFAIDMLMIVWFGRELEKFFGRRRFLWIYAALYLAPALILTVVGTWFPARLAGQTGGLGLFIAFATLYPNAMMLGNILAKWVAIILVGLYALIALSSRDWVNLITLGTTTAVAWSFVRHAQGLLSVPTVLPTRSKPRLRSLPDLPESPKKSAPPREAPASMAEVDALLDKIAKSGIGSLSAKERAVLDSAQQILKKRRSSTD